MAEEILTIQQARSLLMNKVLVFGVTAEQIKHLNEADYDWDPGQKGRVVEIADESVGNDDDMEGWVYRLTVNFKEFEDHNKTLAVTHHYVDGRPMKWHETMSYPRSKLSNVFIGPKPSDFMFAIEDDGKALAPVILSPDSWNKLVAAYGLEQLQRIGVKPL